MKWNMNEICFLKDRPPYNTGNDFVYEDDFAQNMEDYKEVSGDFDEEGNIF